MDSLQKGCAQHMKIIKKIISVENTCLTLLYREYNNSLFFDIETTGLSSENAYIFMIGYINVEQEQKVLTQLMCENAEDECEMLKNFAFVLNRKENVVTYNGNSFDIPFIISRCKKYNIDINIPESIDLYREISKYKKIFLLENYKQKTLERFLGLGRDDVLSGKELIKLYREYVVDRDSEKEALLLLHNYEDVFNLSQLVCIRKYFDIFNGIFSDASYSTEKYLDENNNEAVNLIIKVDINECIPKDLSVNNEVAFIKIHGSQITVSIKAYVGELLYFFDDYKNYYYLPYEDYAIHKSVASYVDKQYRQQAKACNCYTHVKGIFVPAYYSEGCKTFAKNYDDKTPYIALDDKSFSSSDFISYYVKAVFNDILN